MEETAEARKKRLNKERRLHFLERHPNYERDRARARRANQADTYEWPAKRENGLRVTSYKESTPCADCGNKFPACCMDFDHLPGFTKSYAVGTMVAHGHAWEAIQAEMAKCELVCANCHRIRTRDRGRGKKHARVPEVPEHPPIPQGH